MKVYAYLGLKCNLKCKYCNLECDPTLEDTNFKEIYKVLEDLEKQGTKVEYCILSGGETMMYYNDVISLVERFKDVYFKIVSNGTYPDRFRSLFKYTNVLPTLSWDGFESERGFDSTKLMTDLINEGKIFKVSYVLNNTNYMNLKRDMSYLYNLTDIYKDFKNPYFELAIARCDKSYYKFDMELLSKSISETYIEYPQLEIFRKQIECPDAHEGCVKMIRINHDGSVNYESCYSRVNDLDGLKNVYQKCVSCDITICKSKACMMRIETALGYNNDIYCDIQKVIFDTINKVEETKRRYDSMILNTTNIEFILTTGCNLRCTYCFQSHTQHGNYNVISNEIIDKTLDEYISKHIEYSTDYKDKKLTFTLFGGEPIQTITEDSIIYLIDKAKSMDIKFGLFVVTNGLYFSERIVNHIKNNNVNAIFQVSLDINKDIHDSCRIDIAGNPSYDKVIDNLKKYVEHFGKKRVSINSVLTNSNSEHFLTSLTNGSLLELYDIVKGVTIRGDQLTTDYMTPQTIDNLKSFYNTVADMYDSDSIDINKFKYIFEIHKYNPDYEYTGPEYGCGACSSQITVDPQGNIIPCHLVLSDNEYLNKYAFYDIMKGFSTYGINKFNDNLDIYSTPVEFEYNGSKCSSCKYRTGCVRCKVSYELNNGGRHNVTNFTHMMTTVRNSILETRFNNRFKPFTNEEYDEFMKDYRYIEDLEKDGNHDISEVKYGMQKVFVERSKIVD